MAKRRTSKSHSKKKQFFKEKSKYFLFEFLAKANKNFKPGSFDDLIIDLETSEIQFYISEFENNAPSRHKELAISILKNVLKKDAHLIAINNGYFGTSRFLIELLKPEEAEAVFEKSSLYSFPVTPLMVAILSKKPNIVNFLIGRGHVLRKEDIEVNSNMEPNLVYHRCQVFMSPIYINQMKANPFLTCLENTKIIHSLVEKMNKSFKSKFEKIIEDMENYCIKLLSKIHTETDLNLIFCQSVKNKAFDVIEYPVLQEMIQQRWVKFLFEPQIQEFRNKIWMGKYYISEKETRPRFSFLTLIVNIITNMVSFWSVSPQLSYLISICTETWLFIFITLQIMGVLTFDEMPVMFLLNAIWALCYKRIFLKKTRFLPYTYELKVFEIIIMITTGVSCVSELFISITKSAKIGIIKNAAIVSREFLMHTMKSTLYTKIIIDSFQTTMRTVKSSIRDGHVILFAFYGACLLLPTFIICSQLDLKLHIMIDYCYIEPGNNIQEILILTVNLLIVILVEAFTSPEILRDKERNFEWTAKVITEYNSFKNPLPIPYSFVEIVGLFKPPKRGLKLKDYFQCVQVIKTLKINTRSHNMHNAQTHL